MATVKDKTSFGCVHVQGGLVNEAAVYDGSHHGDHTHTVMVGGQFNSSLYTNVAQWHSSKAVDLQSIGCRFSFHRSKAFLHMCASGIKQYNLVLLEKV